MDQFKEISIQDLNGKLKDFRLRNAMPLGTQEFGFIFQVSKKSDDRDDDNYIHIKRSKLNNKHSNKRTTASGKHTARSFITFGN